MQSAARAAGPASGGDRPDVPLAAYSEGFIELFFPIHYQIGMALEATMCGRRLTRSQGAALLLIDAEADAQGHISQKDLSGLMHEQQQLGTSAVSKILRELAREPLKLIEQKESSHSGREKVLSLTSKGMAVVDAMKRDGCAYLEQLFAHVPDMALETGLNFFREVFSRAATAGPAAAAAPTRRPGVSTAVGDSRLHHAPRRRRNDPRAPRTARLSPRRLQRVAREE